MPTHQNERSFWRALRRRGPLRTMHPAAVTIRDLAYWHPDSVYQSLIDRLDWIGPLLISTTAKRLTRLRGRAFRVAVERILASA